MSMGQTMITTLFLTLLILFFIKANQMLIQSNETKYQTEAYELAVAIAQDMLVEASRKKFDEYAANSGTQNVSDFTSSASLGPTTSEQASISPWPDTAKLSAQYFNDFDDYDGYQRTVNTATFSGFQVCDSVYYVIVTNPNGKTSSRTYMKRMDVYVSHPLYLPDPVMFSRIMTY